MAGEGLQVEGYDGDLHVGLEGFVAAPRTAAQSEGAFEGGDDAFDAGAPFAQLFVYARALYKLGEGVAFEGGKRDVLNAQCAGFFGVGFACESAIGGDIFRGLALLFEMSFQGGHELFAVGGVAFFDGAVEDEIAFSRAQKNLVSVNDFALALDYDVGVGLEDGNDFFSGGDCLSIEDAPRALIDNAFCQRRELFESASQCAGGEEFIEALKVCGSEFCYGLFRVGRGFLCRVDESFVQRLLLVLAPRVVDFITQLFGGARVVAEASAQVLEFRFDTAKNPSENANATVLALRESDSCPLTLRGFSAFRAGVF